MHQGKFTIQCSTVIRIRGNLWTHVKRSEEYSQSNGQPFFVMNHNSTEGEFAIQCSMLRGQFIIQCSFVKNHNSTVENYSTERVFVTQCTKENPMFNSRLHNSTKGDFVTLCQTQWGEFTIQHSTVLYNESWPTEGEFVIHVKHSEKNS